MRKRQTSAMHRQCRTAFSLVELLIVMFIVAMFALFAGPAMLRSSRLERNLRSEGYVRTRLILNLERIAREISLANRIDWVDADGVVVEKSTNLNPDERYDVRLFYPEETGGVSFETNHVSLISSVRLSLYRDTLLAAVSNTVDLAPAVQRFHFSAMPAFIGGGDAEFTDFWITNVIVNGVEKTDLVHVTLSSVIRLDDGNGETEEKTITVDRLVRMWNR